MPPLHKDIPRVAFKFNRVSDLEKELLSRLAPLGRQRR